MLGYYAYEAVAKPVLEFYGKLEAFKQLKSHVTEGQLNLLLITSGLAHLPPIKIVTLLAGVAHINLWHFVLSAIVARGLRFYLLAFLLRRYGPAIRHFIELRLKLIAFGGAALLILLYFGLKLLTGSGQLFSC